MKLRVIFFALMTLMVGISNAAKSPNPAKLQPRPIVCIKNICCIIDTSILLEGDELKKKQEKLRTKNGGGDGGSGYEAWVDTWTTFTEKIRTTAANIAKSLGACAVISDYEALYIAPEYDITQRVIDQLNKEYLATK